MNLRKSLLEDIEHMIQIIQGSVISIKQNYVIKDVKQKLQVLQEQLPKNISSNDYYQVMNYIEQSFDDEHTGISCNNLATLYNLQFMGFLVDQNAQVVKSYDNRIKEGQKIQKVVINDKSHSIDEYVSILLEFKGNKGLHQQYLQDVIVTELVLQNIFYPISHVIIGQKRIEVKYQFGFKKLFKTNNILTELKFIRNASQQKDESYSIQIPELKIIYLKQSSFMDKVDIISRNDSISKYKYIIIDLQDNYGGNINTLYYWIHVLYGESIIKLLQKGEHINSLNKEILQQYYEDVIIPVIYGEGPHKQKQYMLKYYNNLIMNSKRKKYHPTSSTSKKSTKTLIEKLKSIRISSNRKLILVTNHTCYSACSWAVKLFKLLPNVIHIGKDIKGTKSTGNAMTVPTRSKLSTIIAPMLYFQFDEQFYEYLQSDQSVDFQLPDSILSDNLTLLLYISQSIKSK